jgi:hypothetical protein
VDSGELFWPDCTNFWMSSSCSHHIFDSAPFEGKWHVTHAYCHKCPPHLSLARESSSNLVARVYKDGKWFISFELFDGSVVLTRNILLHLYARCAKSHPCCCWHVAYLPGKVFSLINIIIIATTVSLQLCLPHNLESGWLTR